MSTFTVAQGHTGSTERLVPLQNKATSQRFGVTSAFVLDAAPTEQRNTMKYEAT